MLNVAILCTKRAPGVDQLLADDDHGSLFEIVCVLSGRKPPKNLELRRSYDAETADIVESYGADIVLLSSYIYVLTTPFLTRFPGRIFNIHDSDLRIVDANGERKYVGLHSTRDAMRAGEPETRATLHEVTEKLDGGRIVKVSDPYPVNGLTPWEQRDWMFRMAWYPLFKHALLRSAGSQPAGAPAPSRRFLEVAV